MLFIDRTAVLGLGHEFPRLVVVRVRGLYGGLFVLFEFARRGLGGDGGQGGGGGGIWRGRGGGGGGAAKGTFHLLTKRHRGLDGCGLREGMCGMRRRVGWVVVGGVFRSPEFGRGCEFFIGMEATERDV